MSAISQAVALVAAAAGMCQCIRPTCKATHVDPDRCGSVERIETVTVTAAMVAIEACESGVEVLVLCRFCAFQLFRDLGRRPSKVAEDQETLW